MDIPGTAAFGTGGAPRFVPDAACVSTNDGDASYAELLAGTSDMAVTFPARPDVSWDSPVSLVIVMRTVVPGVGQQIDFLADGITYFSDFYLYDTSGTYQTFVCPLTATGTDSLGKRTAEGTWRTGLSDGFRIRLFAWDSGAPGARLTYVALRTDGGATPPVDPVPAGELLLPPPCRLSGRQDGRGPLASAPRLGTSDPARRGSLSFRLGAAGSYDGDTGAPPPPGPLDS